MELIVEGGGPGGGRAVAAQEVPMQFSGKSTALRSELPVFHTLDELLRSKPWHDYLIAVYGSTSKFTFPLSLRNFTLFYVDALPKHTRVHNCK